MFESFNKKDVTGFGREDDDKKGEVRKRIDVIEKVITKDSKQKTKNPLDPKMESSARSFVSNNYFPKSIFFVKSKERESPALGNIGPEQIAWDRN